MLVLGMTHVGTRNGLICYYLRLYKDHGLLSGMYSNYTYSNEDNWQIVVKDSNVPRGTTLYKVILVAFTKFVIFFLAYLLNCWNSILLWLDMTPVNIVDPPS